MKKILSIFLAALLFANTAYASHFPPQSGQSTMSNSQPVVIASDQSAVPVSASALPLPSGASTAARQDTGNASLASIDGKITAVNTGAVVVSSSALPSGAATSAKQDTGNTSVASIDTKTPALGQALAAASVPVVLTAAQISTLTPLPTVAATQSGTWNLNNISGTVSLPTGAATAAKQPVLGTAGSASTDVISVQGIASMTPLLVNGSGVTQPVSGTVAATQSGAWNIGTVTAVTAITNALPAGTNAIGKLSPNSGVDIGDVDVTSVGGNVTVVQGTATNLKVQAETYQGGTAVGSGAPLQVTLANGSVPSHPVTNAGTFPVQATSGATRTYKTYSASITSDTDVIAAVTSKKIKVFAYSIITTDNTGDTVLFKTNGTGGTEKWRVYLKGPDADTPFGANLSVAPGLDGAHLFETAAGEKLTADVSSGATLHISISYWDDDAA